MQFEKSYHNQFLVSTDRGSALGALFSQNGEDGWVFEFVRNSVHIEFAELREIANFIETLHNAGSPPSSLLTANQQHLHRDINHERTQYRLVFKNNGQKSKRRVRSERRKVQTLISQDSL